MSTSVYSTVEVPLYSRMPNRMYICNGEIRKVKRVLFEPPDHFATQKFVEEELAKITMLQSEKWNFDFQKEKTLKADGEYQWRLATPQKVTRPCKMRPSVEEEDLQDELYPEPQDIRSTSVRTIEEEEMKSPPKARTTSNPKQQRLITGEYIVIF